MNHIYVYSPHFYLKVYISLGADKENLFIDQEIH